MIKPHDKVLANLITQLHCDLSREPLTRIVNLAAVALGILRSKSLQVGQIVTALPLDGTRDSLKKRVQRFLKNASVTVEAYYEPVARRILQLLPGERRFWLQVTFTQTHAVPDLNLAMYWAPTAPEPWYLITTEPTCKLACASYAKRFRIEEMFKDFKNTGRGFGLELTGVRHADRLARLLLALALVYTWLLLWGAYVIAAGQQKLVDNVRKPTLSLFQTGLRFVLRLWQPGQLRKFHWHLSMLTEATN